MRSERGFGGTACPSENALVNMPVVLECDSNSAALAEYRFRAGESAKPFLRVAPYRTEGLEQPRKVRIVQPLPNPGARSWLDAGSEGMSKANFAQRHDRGKPKLA